ncbi:hypothetical protein HDV01_007054 [Terramyces sp. JEL0728]|nr:hypothetical protein HDV01_007054 [Terramyces sp. JEL0728]
MSTTTRITLFVTGVLSGLLVYNLIRERKEKSPKEVSAISVDEPGEYYGIDESENLLNLLLSITQEQTMSGALLLTKTHTFIKIKIPIPPQANPRSMIFPPLYPGLLFNNVESFDTGELEKETHFDQMEIQGFYEQFKSLSTLPDDGGITRQTFEKCLGNLKKESYVIVDRIFSFFDQDRDEIISFEEMVRGLSVLIKVGFQGYDLNGDGVISKDELRKMFKSYFVLSMELVRGVVKVMEEGMLDSFDDEATKPVSAAFGAPSTLESSQPQQKDEETQTRTEDRREERTEETRQRSGTLNRPISNLSHVVTTFDDDDTPPPTRQPRRIVSFDMLTPSPRSLDLRPALPFLQDDEHVPIMESISQDAIEEMISQIYSLVGKSEGDLTFEDFKIIVENDVNILAWIEALGSVF